MLINRFRHYFHTIGFRSHSIGRMNSFYGPNGQIWGYFHDNHFAFITYDIPTDSSKITSTCLSFLHVVHYFERSGKPEIQVGVPILDSSSQRFPQKGIILAVTDEFLRYIQEWYDVDDVVIDHLFDGEPYYTISAPLLSALSSIEQFRPSLLAADTYYKSKLHEIMAILIHHADQDILSDWTNAIQPYMKDRLATGLTIEQLAKTFSLSRTELIARYKKHFGETIGATIDLMRREKASSLLATTNESLGFISDQLGFKRQSSFSEWFRSRFHMTPLAYRKQLQNAHGLMPKRD